ncbi:MAG TPA: chemotaxis protein CheA [Caulobacteraceae bacterium]|nr:chemotaxis protein CheA [Caulobacteraceae bacterium]
MSDELLDQFMIEAPELVAQASDDLLALEQAPDDRARLDSAFRAIHTLKGSVGLFGFDQMGAMLHAGEDLLGAIRDGRLGADDEMLGALLDAMTRTEQWLGDIERGGAPLGEDGGLGARIRALLDAPAIDPAVGAPAGLDADWVRPLLARLGPDAAPKTAVRYRPDASCYFAGDDPLQIARKTPELLALRVGLCSAPASLDCYDPFACNLEIAVVSGAGSDAVRAAFRFVPDQIEIVSVAGDAAIGEPAPAAAAQRRGLRIDAARIDDLSSLVDDLVVAKTALAELDSQARAGLEPARLVDALAVRRAEIDQLVERLHGAVVGLRLAPLTPTLRRLPRFVRGVAGELGKQVELTIRDEGAMADKSVVEGLFDPLIHLLRNAIDHGVEASDARRAAGKPEQGRLTLSVARRGDLLTVAVTDDGRGIDPARVRAAAQRRGLMNAAALAALSDAETTELIFRPGFSTSETVSSVSGRGVGMDAVRNSLAKLGGTVSVASSPGRSTTVSINLPVSVVMTRLLVVESNRELYGVPMSKVIETARIAAKDAAPIRAGRAVVLRDTPAPLFDLGELLGGAPPDWTGADYTALVVASPHGPIAVRIDGLRQSLDTVMRPLRGLLAGMPGVVGSTLLGDGRVMMVLDPAELVA